MKPTTSFNSKDSSERMEEIKELSSFEAHPLLYAHMIIKQVIKSPHMAFMQGETKAGFYSMVFGVDQLERVCRAEGSLKVVWSEEEEYQKRKQEIEKDEDLKDGVIKSAKIANLKLEFILSKLFKQRSKNVDVIL